MKAAVIDRYGAPNVVHLAEVPTPVPRENEVLVRVVAAAVTAADSRIRAARFPRGFAPFARLVFGVLRPRRRILGGAFSGVVEAVGAQVTEWVPGDEVCAMVGFAMGAHAELIAVPAKKLARKPAEVTHEDAAGVLFGGTTALYFLRDRVGLKPGETVLVNGASGAIGTNAVQLAKHFGATVTGISSARNLELVLSLGADRVVDYARTAPADLTDRFDVVLDTVGTLSPAAARRLLANGGRAVLAVADLWATLTSHGNVITGSAPERVADIDVLLRLVADRHLKVVLDQVVGLDTIVAAHERVDSGHKVGNVIVRPGA